MADLTHYPTTRHDVRDLPTPMRDCTTLVRDQPTLVRGKRRTTSGNGPHQSSEQSIEHSAPGRAASRASARGKDDGLHYDDPWTDDEQRYDLVVEKLGGILGPGDEPAIQAMIDREMPLAYILNVISSGKPAA